MNILIVHGGKGSGEIRGKQLGAALEARVTRKPRPDDWRWAEAVVLVKQAAWQYGPVAKLQGVPILWDVLDVWGQPADNDVPVSALVSQVQSEAKRFGVSTLIGATEAMAADLDGIYLPHHHTIGLKPAPFRHRPKVVAYEGIPKYLGTWMGAVASACHKHGLTFVMDPPDLAQVDIVVAFRDGVWDGPLCRRWKSGVKFVNAIAAGCPVLSQPCSAFDELKPVGMTIHACEDVADALSELVHPSMRRAAWLEGCERQPEFSVETIAATYRTILERAQRKAA